MNLRECTEIVKRDMICLDISTNSSSSIHGHPFFEIVYVLSGTVEHTRDNKTMIIQPGDYFMVNLNSLHSYKPVNDFKDFKIINCMFMPQFIDNTLADARHFQDILNNYLVRFGYRKFDNSPTQSIYHDKNQKIRYLMTEMMNEYIEQAPGYTEVLRHYLVNTIIHLVRNEANKEDAPIENITQYINQYVAEHYMEPLHLSDLVNDIGFSLSNISKTYKEHTNMNFRDYLQKVRIKKACELLKVSDKTINEISALVGYSDPAFFYRIFKKLMHMTPLEYKKQFD